MDPMPRYEDPTNTHGTRCAGEIAMVANNEKCGVGIAFNAKVGGIVLLDGKTNDEMEAKALTNALSMVDIYNGSWGPQDNGKSVDGPGELAQMALEIGVTTGRKGKGSIYVFASGNGRIQFDNCAADGYVGSIYTVVVSSVTEDGKAPEYAERCAAVMVTAYSGGFNDNIKIVTSDINNTCTLSHSGTSAAAPLVAGVIALALESNGNLTWRDVQHLLARNCEKAPLSNNYGWSMNAAGFSFNPSFGFGLLNAYRLVKEAIGWRTVPEKSICAVNFDVNKNSKYFGRAWKFTSAVNTDGCMGRVKYLEHVQLSMTVQYPKRGMVEVDLWSPNNSTCKMMEPRMLDESRRGFLNWKIMSLQFWGEQPFGKWDVFIKDETSDLYAGLSGSVEKLQLIMHGTEKHPYNF